MRRDIVVIYSKRILTNKQPEEILHIIRNAAYFGACKIEQERFSLKCVRRTPSKGKLVVPVTGFLTATTKGTEVCIKLHAEFGVFVGIAFFAYGIAETLIRLFLPAQGMWLAGLGTMLFGAFIATFFYLRTIEIADLLESKLLH